MKISNILFLSSMVIATIKVEKKVMRRFLSEGAFPLAEREVNQLTASFSNMGSSTTERRAVRQSSTNPPNFQKQRAKNNGQRDMRRSGRRIEYFPTNPPPRVPGRPLYEEPDFEFQLLGTKSTKDGSLSFASANSLDTAQLDKIADSASDDLTLIAQNPFTSSRPRKTSADRMDYRKKYLESSASFESDLQPNTVLDHEKRKNFWKIGKKLAEQELLAEEMAAGAERPTWAASNMQQQSGAQIGMAKSPNPNPKVLKKEKEKEKSKIKTSKSAARILSENSEVLPAVFSPLNPQKPKKSIFSTVFRKADRPKEKVSLAAGDSFFHDLSDLQGFEVKSGARKQLKDSDRISEDQLISYMPTPHTHQVIQDFNNAFDPASLQKPASESKNREIQQKMRAFKLAKWEEANKKPDTSKGSF